MIPHLDEAGLRAALPGTAAVDALAAAFRAGVPEGPARSHLAVPGGDLLLMPASGTAGAGVKLVTVAPANPGRGLPLISGLYVLFAPETLVPVALIDGAALTAVRTAAVSALATRELARDDASHLVVLGAGTQARSHVAALRLVRPIGTVTVVSRTRGSAAALAADLRSWGLEAEVGDPTALRRADVVCACTTSDTPVVRGDHLPPGVHVNAVGAYRPTSRELDTAAVLRGSVVVEHRPAALAEAGDLAIPIAEGTFRAEDIAADLAEVMAGAAVRRTPEDVTIFKSVGLAMEDLAVATAAVAALDLGQ